MYHTGYMSYIMSYCIVHFVCVCMCMYIRALHGYGSVLTGTGNRTRIRVRFGLVHDCLKKIGYGLVRVEVPWVRFG